MNFPTIGENTKCWPAKKRKLQNSNYFQFTIDQKLSSSRFMQSPNKVEVLVLIANDFHLT